MRIILFLPHKSHAKLMDFHENKSLTVCLVVRKEREEIKMNKIEMKRRKIGEYYRAKSFRIVLFILCTF